MKKADQTNFVRYGELRRIKGVTTVIKTDVAGKQDKLTEEQMAAVNSGITAQALSRLDKLFSWFDEDDNGDIYVRAKDDDAPRNFYTFGNVAAGGNGGGGEVGDGTLYALNDVLDYNGQAVARDATHPAQTGDILAFDGDHWHAIEPSSAGTEVSWGTTGTDTQVLTVDGVSKTLITAHQSLSAYRTAADQDTIDNAIKARLGDTTSSNPAADKAFVNSSIATSTATFRGTSASGLTEAQFLSWANGLTKDNNDYVFWNTVDSAGNTQYKRYKYNGSSWVYEYTLNNSSFTAEQWAAIGSGITSALVTKLNGIATGAQVNVLEKVKLNGSELTITSKAVNVNAATSLSVPTGLSAGNLDNNGNIAISFASGYSIPTTSKQASWDTGLDTLAALKAWIEGLLGVDSNGDVYVKGTNNAGDPRNFYSYGDVSAGGNGGGGGGGAGVLYALNDVTAYNNQSVGRDSSHPAQSGDLLAFDGSHWHAVVAPATGVTSIGGKTGAITLGSNLSMSGNALTVANFVKSVASKTPDSSGNVALSAADLGAETTTHASQTYLPLSGGNVNFLQIANTPNYSCYLDIAQVSANVNYISIKAIDSNGSYPNARPIVLQYGEGNVGINTPTPAYKLDINGSFNATSGYINGNTIYNSGNVNNTSTPWSASNLTLNGTINGLLSVEFAPPSNASHGGFIDFHYAGSTADYTSRFWESASGRLEAACSTLYIVGKVGVGASTPYTPLDVSSTLAGDINTTTIYSTAIAAIGQHNNDALFIGKLSNSSVWLQSSYCGTSAAPASQHTYPLLLNPLGGNVAVGGATASEKLHVYGNILATGNITMSVASGNSPSLIFNRGTLGDTYNDWRLQDRSGYLYFEQNGTAQGTGWDTRMYITPSLVQVYGQLFTSDSIISNGTIVTDSNMGVGTRNPAYKLDVVGGAIRSCGDPASVNNVGLIVTNTVSNRSIQFIYGSSGKAGIYSPASGWIEYLDTNNGWHVVQNEYRDTGHIYLDGANVNSSTSNSTQIVFRANSSQQIALSSNLNALIINPTTTSTTNQCVISCGGTSKFSGDIQATGDVAAGSDRRWKHNITPVLNGIDTLMRLKPSTWEWNSDNHRGYGLIAQEVQEVIPDLVKPDAETYLHLNYNGLHAFEVSALQSHETRIEYLERRVKEQDEIIKRLRS